MKKSLNKVTALLITLSTLLAGTETVFAATPSIAATKAAPPIVMVAIGPDPGCSYDSYTTCKEHIAARTASNTAVAIVSGAANAAATYYSGGNGYAGTAAGTAAGIVYGKLFTNKEHYLTNYIFFCHDSDGKRYIIVDQYEDDANGNRIGQMKSSKTYY